jgi:hypothetical protein
MKNFKPAYFDNNSAYVPMMVQPQLFQFKVAFNCALRQRGDTGVISDRIFVSLHQLGVQLHGIRVSKFDATITIVIPLDVTIASVVDAVTARVLSVLQALA